MRNKYKIVFRLLLLFVLPFLTFRICEAASANIDITAKDKTVKKGDTVIVSIYLTSDDLIGDFEGYLSYNADILEFDNDGGVAAGGEGLVKITDTNVPQGDTERKYALKFHTLDYGEAVLSLTDETGVYAFDTGDNMSVSRNQLKIEVVSDKSVSDNTNLKELKITPGTLSKEFSKENTSYQVTVGLDINQLVISALAEDDKATVSITGNKDFKTGHNTVEISVKAQSGKVRTYTIDVLKEEASEETGEENPGQDKGEVVDSTAIGKLQLEKEADNTYLTGGFYLHLLTPGEDVTIPEGYEKTSLIVDGTAITVYANTLDLDSDFLLVYGENKSGLKGFYQLDRRENTVQRFNPVSVKEGEKLVIPKNARNIEHYQNQIVILGIVAAVLLGICSALAIGIIRMVLKNKNTED
ncbi:cadherin-like beta sandwich domain-containing protein [Anaerocolumna xylanovorans]|uniref:Cadherin-like beta sandwich domain-containing protein n=1 Tax=Anaerocolumna xylanovorans DSM 12503 TaxID=1121345 RepID=A0A1M7YD77_9FIRM|nr:cadherin-like beta sandwich domain-containing protein [Anaerocolumna xylanovorans]SHO50602.1 Cadherin-like beta sandwich domain-containing protein [Anaerocolumna xylanovorans DSM 12503]